MDRRREIVVGSDAVATISRFVPQCDLMNQSMMFISSVPHSCGYSMIRKSGYRFSLATNADRVCAEIMLKQRGETMIRSHLSDHDSSGDNEDFG